MNMLKRKYLKFKEIIRLLIGVIVFNLMMLWSLPGFSQEEMNNDSKPNLIPAASPASQSIASQKFEIKNDLEAAKSNPSGSGNAPAALLPPGNDNCATALLPAYSLAPNANCKGGTFLGATKELGETFGGAGCAAAATNQSVWYSFIASQTDMWVDVKATSFPLICSYNFGISVWRWLGTCPPAAGFVGCKNFYTYPGGAQGNAVYNILNMTGLIPGATYLVQLTQRNSCAGLLVDDFCVAVGTPLVCNTCANVCGPMCVWAGPSPPTVPQVTSSCPSYPQSPPMNQNDTRTNCFSFVAPNDTINLQQVVFTYCNPGNTFSFTYDLYTSGCAPIQSGNVFANNMITNLTVGQTYRICYTLTAACTWDSVFWPYAYTNSSALPVELVSFGGIPFSEKVKIYWATASEENSSEFVIERTYNGREFYEVSKVKAAGNSTGLIHYKSFDNAPLEGKNFYRLKQIDFDGRVSYTKLIAVDYSKDARDISIMPNPAQDLVYVVFNSTGNNPAILNISDLQGRNIFHEEFISSEGINEFPFDLSGLKNGLYSVQLILEEQSNFVRLVKN